MPVFLTTSPAASSQASSDRVPTQLQQLRDDERLSILQAELDREQRVEATAAQHAAAARSAHDIAAIAEAEATRERAAESIASLQREMTRTRNRPPAPHPDVTGGPERRTPPAPGLTGPWWDVYARPAGRNAPDALPDLRTSTVRPQ
jgi:hypothetical protein